jgi:hypothetical protein
MMSGLKSSFCPSVKCRRPGHKWVKIKLVGLVMVVESIKQNAYVVVIKILSRLGMLARTLTVRQNNESNVKGL